MLKKALSAGSLFVLVGSTMAGCAGTVDGSEPLGSAEDEMTVATCATATRNAVLVSTVEQATGISSPAPTDNAGCDEGYVVEFDGTVNGVHYGYRLDDPRPGSADGIRVTFASPVPKLSGMCEGNVTASAYLYEKLSNGTWVLRRSLSVGSTTIYNPGSGDPTGCSIPGLLFPQVKKGSAATPHIYRIAASEHVAFPADFYDGPPAGKGYGPVTVRAADAAHL